MNNNRRQKLKEISTTIQSAINALEFVKEEEDSVRENIPDNFENSDLYENSEACSDAIDDAIYSLNEAMGSISDIT